jgi:hypothetical protein
MDDHKSGTSEKANIPGVFGVNTAGGDALFGSGEANGRGVVGTSIKRVGVEGFSDEGIAIYGSSRTGRAVVGVTESTTAVEGNSVSGIAVFGGSKSSTGVAGYSDTGMGVYGSGQKGGRGVVGVAKNASAVEGNSESGAGVWGSSQTGEGIHAETNSSTLAAIAGINLNKSGTGAAIYGKKEGSSGHAGFFDGNLHVTGNMTSAGDICLTGADCAEDFDVFKAESIDPGTVMIVGKEGALHQSYRAYDRRVAGVISGAGDYRPGLVLDKQQEATNRKPVALVGKVFVKVNADYAPIEVGDLLTTSDTLGHAMKASDPTKSFGSVIGKALRPLEAGQGLIPILIALQ